MSDPVNSTEPTKPKVSVGVYIFDRDGKLMLAGSPKWQGMFIPCGGHIDYGETWIDAAKREAYEETGLEVDSVELVTVANLIDLPYFSKKGHFVSLQVKAQLAGSADEVKMDGREVTEVKWLKPEEWLREEKLEPKSREVIEQFLVNKNSAGANEDYKAGWQRAQADYQNLKREMEDQKKDWAAWSELRVLEEFIPVYNNFKKAMEFAPPELDGDAGKAWLNWKKGVEFIMQQFAGILKSHQVEEIKTVGEMFDPTRHESMVEEASDAPEHTIIREITPGYTMKGKVVQVAKVVVAKKAE